MKAQVNRPTAEFEFGKGERRTRVDPAGLVTVFSPTRTGGISLRETVFIPTKHVCLPAINRYPPYHNTTYPHNIFTRFVLICTATVLPALDFLQAYPVVGQELLVDHVQGQVDGRPAPFQVKR